MRRSLGIALGVLTHVLFAWTVWRLFWFLQGGSPPADRAPPSSGVAALWWDAALAGQFAVAHSALLHPAVRERLGRHIASAFYGCFFCVVTCLSLLLMIAGWRGIDGGIWRLHGWADVALQAAFYAAWVALFYSLSLTGLGYQTGWTPWWHWLRGRRLPPREFRPRGAYLLLRHPIYLSFLGLVWFTPVMSWDRAVLTAVWTPYIFIGSYLKDQRLAYYLGATYRQYQSRVAGYPFFPFRPLGKLKPPPATGTI